MTTDARDEAAKLLMWLPGCRFCYGERGRPPCEKTCTCECHTLRDRIAAALVARDAAGYERGLREAVKIVDDEMILAAKSDWPQAAGCLGAVSIKIAALLPKETP